MLIARGLWVGLIFRSLTVVAATAATVQLPIQPPRWTGLSPDGSALTWVQPQPQGDVVMWKPLAQPNSGPRLLWRADGWIEGIHWIDQQILVRSRKGKRVRWYRVQWPGGGQKLLLSEALDQRRGPQVLRVLDNGTVLFSNDRRRPWVPDLFRLGAEGKIKLLEANPGDLFRWHPGPDGQTLLARRWKAQAAGPAYDWLWRPDPQQPWQRIRRRTLDQEAWRLLGFSADSRQAFVGQAGAGKKHILDLARGVLAEDTLSALAGPGNDSGSSEEQGTEPTELVTGWRSESSQAFDASSQADLARLGSLALGRKLFWLGQSSDGSVWQTGPDPAGLQLYTVNPTTVQRWPGIALAAGRPVSVYRFDSRDGQSVELLVTEPLAAAKGSVLLIHGGPWSHDTVSWNAEAQWLAGLGYSVLQVNFRGSTNAGARWQWAGRQQWSGQMLDDLEDAVVWARQQQLPGSQQLCAMGSSFGGYAALMLAARDHPVTRCSVARAAVSDVAAQINYLKTINNQRGFAEWQVMVGDPHNHELMAASPLGLAEKISGPVLLSHGELDHVVLMDQSLGLLKRLRAARGAAGKDHGVRWVKLSGQGHDLRSGPARSAWYQQVAGFLDHALADDG